jgi:hypothetical protein
MKKITNIILCIIILLTVSCALSEGYATPTDLSNTASFDVYEQEPEVHVSIKIWFEEIPNLKIGDTIHIYSEVTGGEGRVLKYQWQYLDSRIDDPLLENGWHDIIDANEPIYEFIIDRENAWYYYRLQVSHWREGDNVE